MKKLLIIALLGAILLNGCKPVYDPAPDIGNPPTATIEILGQPDPNHVIFKANYTDGFLVFWDFGTGVTSTKEIDTAYYPFAKDYTVTLIVTGKGGTTTTTTVVTIDQIDPNLANSPGIKELTDQGQGRVWVFAKDNCDPEGKFFYMTAGYNWQEYWWDPVADSCCDAHTITDDSIKFDLDGDFNYTLYHNGEIVYQGTFLLDLEDSTLKFFNANLPYANINTGLLNPDALSTALFEIKALNDTILKLWQNQAVSGDYTYGWMWVFKPVGVTYNCGN